MKSILITGANGFVGSHLTKLFSDRGKKVYALVQKDTNYESIKDLDNVKIMIFDLKNVQEIQKELPLNIDVLYHLAWVGVSSTLKNDEEIQLKNIEYSLNILKLAREIGIKKIIFTGSVSEYAYNKEAVSGIDIPSPADFYSATKVATHYVCDIYARLNNLNFIWVLISSIYGPGREDNNLITYSIKSFLKKERPSFTRLEQRWDYIYIDDLLEALYSVGEAGKNQMIYPIGSGENFQLYHYVKVIRNLIDKNLPIGIGDLPYKTKQIDNSVVDISKLKSDTGYIPKYSFERGISKTIEYFKQKYTEE
ncbi:NAD(P)-dependent oxidoreductase [Anaerocolumna sp. AGMB13025]|uniref:NAD-dependent epimerase/dehydratase family protein n=1 Tax=Anaerocolumna sp. AGMB13025 TaxID=3039116 RepID=UPI00242045A9|nr:NAD(P)-dependent oxidoreductase [Anaerocolumna sp. AGMB13025]WFR56312.1 NAD(P)-dependent oxidoreductase [Anaerocolumna sp. AGMB13025]